MTESDFPEPPEGYRFAFTPEPSEADGFAFTPVPRARGRRDGWTEAKQRDFIAALAGSGSVAAALRAVGMKAPNAYRLRAAPGAASFAAAWDRALDHAASRVRDVLFDQTINGIAEPIMYQGVQVAERRRFNHRTMMWVLQHHKPDLYPGAKRLPHLHEDADADDLRGDLEERITTLQRGIGRERTRRLSAYADDPAKRAAYETLYGPFDWAGLSEGAFDAFCEPHAARDDARPGESVMGHCVMHGGLLAIVLGLLEKMRPNPSARPEDDAAPESAFGPPPASS